MNACQPDSLGSDFYSEIAKLLIDSGPIGVWSELENAEQTHFGETGNIHPNQVMKRQKCEQKLGEYMSQDYAKSQPYAFWPSKYHEKKQNQQSLVICGTSNDLKYNNLSLRTVKGESSGESF